MRPTTCWKAACAESRACLSVSVVRRFTVAVDFDIDYTWPEWLSDRRIVAVGVRQLAPSRLFDRSIKLLRALFRGAKQRTYECGEEILVQKQQQQQVVVVGGGGVKE